MISADNKSVEELFSEINASGWMVLNLFQFGPSLWRCNLQKRSESGGSVDFYTEYADGANPREAITAAIINTAQPRNNKGAMRTGRGPAPDNKPYTPPTPEQDQERFYQALRSNNRKGMLEVALKRLTTALEQQCLHTRET